MRIVIALGGNALLRRGQPMSDEAQRENVSEACDQIAPIALDHELVVSHGNGPQVGLLALRGAAFEDAPPQSLDVLGAETQGMIGYMVEQELGNRLPFDKPIATLLTMIEVDPADPAFMDPTKPIGPFYDRATALALRDEKGWAFHSDGDAYRRVVPSPRPQRIFELRQIRWLLEKGTVVICAGGGGIPTMYGPEGSLVGVEAVIDKDHASGLLAVGVEADRFVMATDTDGVYVDWKQPHQRRIRLAHPDALDELADQFPPGSMGPKVAAACDFARATGKTAGIGALSDIHEIVSGGAGTVISTGIDGIEFHDDPPTEGA